MIPTHLSGRRSLALLASVALASTAVQAQTAPQTPPTAPSSTAATPPKEEALLMTPFEVSTAKDRGYAAGNTLSGGRADTPIAITPASISVMTREFLTDFGITDMNQAAGWTIGMNPSTGGENGPFGGNRFESNFRGAGGSSNYPSRNGSLQYFVADEYNTERFEFSRGPNSALFGDAAPGGMQGSSSKQARFNDRSNSLTLRADSYGGYRATVDSTYGLDRFSLRLNALRQETKGYQDHTNNTENAITLAASFKITANTQLRAEYERTAEWQLQYRKTYNENVSLWDRVSVSNDPADLTLGNGNAVGLERINQNTDNLVYNFGVGQLFNYKGNQYRTRGLGYAIPWEGNPNVPNFRPGISKSFNLGPADVAFDRDLNNRGIYLDHRFTPDLFVQFAFLSHDIDPVQLYLTGMPNDYRIDVNRLLPNGATNPNFGKAYSDFGQGSQYQSNGVREYRFISSYKFEVPKWWDMKQNFVANGGYRQDKYQAWTRGYRWTNNPLNANPTQGANALNYRVYWDQPRANLLSALPPTVAGMTFKNMDTGFAADNDRRLTYGQLVSQTSFFQERLGITASMRRDKIEDDVLGNVGFDPVTYAIQMGAFNSKTLRNEVGFHGKLTTYRTSKNAGVVVYPFPTQMRWLSPLGFVANYSQNFLIPSTGAPLLNGSRPIPPVATTRDFGVRYSMPNGVAYATLSHYNTEQIGNISGWSNLGNSTPSSNNPGFRDIWRNLGYTDPDLTGDNFNYRDISNRKLEGWEFELTANPTRNLTLTANYGHAITTTLLDSPDRRAYYAAHQAEFKAGAAATAGTVLNGHTIVDPAIIASAIQNIENNFNGFAPGTLANGSERHRINLAAAYRFTEGTFRGLGVNAGAQYRGHRKAASRDANIKFQTATPTPDQIQAAAFDYLWTDPTWYTTAGVNYTRRFGRYSTRFQLNIENVLNDGSPQWTGYSTINAGQLQNIQGVPSGAPTVAGGNNRMQVLSGFNQLDPRKFIFTTTLSF